MSSDWESGSGTTEGAEPVSGTSRGPPRSNAGGATAAAAGSAATPAAAAGGGLERQGSVVHRERMIAHSTALESITMDVVDHNPGASSSVVAANAVSTAPVGGGGASMELPPSTAHHNYHSRGSATVTKDFHPDLDQLDPLGTNNVWGGIPAKSHRGENLLLFIGMIDILQSYGMFKKVGSSAN